MKQLHRPLTALMLLVCLLAQAACPVSARAAAMTAGDGVVELIRRSEGFSETMYKDGGKWYVGYGSQVKEDAYPDGITEEEAEELLRAELKTAEAAINKAMAQNGVTLTQGQFDALLDFTYTLGTSWLNGTSLLRKLVCGEVELSRRETARAFGVWCHAGGVVLPGLANRRLEEAALWLDGDLSAADEFCWLAVTREKDVTYATDFGVYERGGTYDAFPTMFRLGWTPVALETSDGKLIRLGDKVKGNRSGSIVWEKNEYSTAFDDVLEENWFYDYVMELSEGGVINGRGDGTYAPQLPTTTGEALKLILLAAGHPEQAATGKHWASGYADYALSRGWLGEDLLSDLSAPITRRNIARLAALALGFGPSFDETPFADVDDGYATALGGISVLEGVIEDGERLFYPDKSIARAEISTIVWRLRRASAFGTKQTVTYGSRTIELSPDVPRISYDKNGFSGSGRTMTYDEPGVTVLRGVDASRWNGDVDWEAAAADGVDFAILRVGGRYQQSGELYDDSRFEEYYAAAHEAGLKIGVYFYSQAISTKEAIEEADYVLEKLEGKEIDAPVVFDWETAESSSARTHDTLVSVVCDCAVAYCERVREAGYTPMVYMNSYDGYLRYDVSRLTDYAFWYAGQYGGAYPKFAYDFAIWQYDDEAEFDGFHGGTDADLWFIR